MLVLSMEKNNEIFIGFNKEITVSCVEIRGDKVRMGFTADKSVPIDRSKVFESKVADGSYRQIPVEAEDKQVVALKRVVSDQEEIIAGLRRQVAVLSDLLRAK